MKFSLKVFRHSSLVCLVLLKGATLAEPVVAAKSREVILEVVDEARRPMADTPVVLIGTDRFARGSDDPWRFVADARGQCVVQLGCFRNVDQPEGTWDPGWGEYYFVAESRGLRGVSICVAHEEKERKDWNAINLINDTDEWSKRGLAWTSSKPLRVLLCMKRGMRVEGRVVDRGGRPVPDFEVPINQDLHHQSHTGYGGQIFSQTTFTDSQGRFSLAGVYPNTFYPQTVVHEDTLPVWVRTEVRGKWIGQPAYSITPRRHEKVIRLTLEVARTLPYRCYGRVVDRAGRTIAGAHITIGISRHDPMETDADSHTSLQTESDDDGRFEARCASPFIPFIRVLAAGYAEHEEDYDTEEGVGLRRAGKWKIILRRGPNQGQK